MTAIVGLIHNGDVYMGADSAGSNDSYISSRRHPKIFRNGDYIIGYTSSFRMGQLLQHSFKAPEPPRMDDTLVGFMATVFVDAIRDCFKEGGWSEIEKGRELGGTFMVGVSGHLFKIEGNFQVDEEDSEYSACGSGAYYALGSLHSTSRRGIGPTSRLELALDAAEHFCPQVRSPFHYLVLRGNSGG